jgi:hypothetical protein
MEAREVEDRGERGGAAIEMLLLLPFIILLNCFIIQIAHLFIAYQVVQYGAFAAARAAMVADVNPADAPAGTDWKSKASTGNEYDRPIRAAAQICSILEIMAPPGSFTWHKAPIRINRKGYSDTWALARYRFFPGDRPGNFLKQVLVTLPSGSSEDEVRVVIVYETFLPVPFANRIIYQAFVESGRGASDLRVNVIQACTVVKPWM